MKRRKTVARMTEVPAGSLADLAYLERWLQNDELDCDTMDSGEAGHGLRRRVAPGPFTSEERQALNAKRGLSSANGRTRGQLENRGRRRISARPGKTILSTTKTSPMNLALTSTVFLHDAHQMQQGTSLRPRRSLTSKQLAESLDDELVALIDEVVKAGVYHQFFEQALTNWSVVCRCHKMRLTFPKHALLWNECDRAHVAKYARQVSDNQQRLREVGAKTKQIARIGHPSRWSGGRLAVVDMHRSPPSVLANSPESKDPRPPGLLAGIAFTPMTPCPRPKKICTG